MVKIKQILILPLILSTLLLGKELKVSASVNRTSIQRDEIIKYSIKVEGVRNIRVPQPEFKNFQIARGPSRSSRFQIINGDVTSSKTVSWWLSPEKTGQFTIAPVQIKYQGQTRQTEGIKIKVLKSQQRQAGKQSKSTDSKNESTQKSNLKDIFFKAEPEQRTVYEGEQLNVDFVLYFRRKVQNFARRGLPEGTNFWTEEFKPPRRPEVSKVKYKGKQYRRAVIQKIAFFPTKTGELTIDPMKIKVEVVEKTQRKERGFFSDSFFGNSFFSETEVVSLTSKPLHIQVKALPSPVPNNFSGGVGQYSIEASIDTEEVKQNEAFSVRYRIQGQGNINSVSMSEPEISFPAEIFDPQIDRNSKKREDLILGNLSYEYVIIPKESGRFEIPGYKFVYFDTKQGDYVTKKTSRLSIRVKENLSNTDTNRLTRSRIQQLNQDIRYIKNSANSWREVDKEFYDHWWFWTLNIASILIFIGSIVYQKRQEKFSNSQLSRRRKAYKNSKKKMKQVEKTLAKKDYERASSQLYKTVTKYIADKLGLSATSVNIKQSREALEEQEVDQNVINNTIELLQELEQMKFAPEMRTEGELQSLAERTKELINELQQEI